MSSNRELLWRATESGGCGTSQVSHETAAQGRGEAGVAVNTGPL